MRGGIILANERNQYYEIPNPEYIEYPEYPQGHCVRCGGNLPPMKRKYCSNKCLNIFYRTKSKTRRVWWNEFREIVLRRDKHHCTICDSKGDEYGRLDVHHIIPISKGGEFLEIGNCITLCPECHKAKHKKRKYEPRADLPPLTQYRGGNE